MAVYYPPRDPFELQVARAAASVLPVPSVGIRDDLLGLGLTDRKAQAVSAYLLNVLGRRASAESIVAALTPEMIAHHYRKLPRVADWSSLVELRPGPLPPLVCVHPLGGNAFWYLPLARKLGGANPIYGLHSRGLDLYEAVQNEIPAIAASYVKDLRQRVPRGPYSLLGWSFGGAVAYEMARQIVQEEDTVNFVAMCDVGPDDMGQMPDSADAAFALLIHAVRLDHLSAELVTVPAPSRLEELFRRCVAANRLPPGYSRGDLARMLDINRAHLRAMKRYRFCSYDGRLILFRSADRKAVEKQYLGWEDCVRGELRAHEIAGSHFDALNKANLDVIAHHLRLELSAVSR
jgi:thioesterase domain-containing protein